jgi:hypothetical protein|tara:strand:- start:2337 stop:2912 length:576 start_codon:yes stop_codon:yes gene_type:complete
MAYVLFISEDKLKDSTAINMNVDVNFLLPYVRIAQKKYIETKLGTNLFEAIQLMISGGTIGLPANSNYKTLLDDYIADVLVHYAFYEVLPFLRYKVQNNNVVSKTAENSNPLSRAEAQDLRSEISNTAQFYTERLVDYLCNNNNLFPEYSTNTGSDVNPDSNAYYQGMNLERQIIDDTKITIRDFLDTTYY